MKKYKIVWKRKTTGIKMESPPVFTKRQAEKSVKRLLDFGCDEDYSIVSVDNLEYETFFSKRAAIIRRENAAVTAPAAA